MAIFKENIIRIDLEKGNIKRTFCSHAIGMMDQQADHFGVEIYRDGEPVDLTGVTCQGVFMPPVGDPIAVTGSTYTSVDGNRAEVILPQACYNYDGPFTLAIKLVDSANSVTGTMRIVDGVVDNTHASGTVAPTGAVPTYQEVLSTYDAMVAATAAANGAIAATYSSSSTYAVGDYCIHDGGLYRCTTAITTAEAWTSGHWTAAKIGPDVSDLKSAMNNITDCVQHNLVPYACNGSDNNILNVAQSGNDVTISGTSSASAAQANTKILLTDHIYSWNANSVPSSEQVYPIRLLNDHTYKVRFSFKSGTRAKGDGTGKASVRLYDSSDYLVTVALDIDSTSAEETFVSNGENVQLRMFVSRYMTLTSAVFRIEIEDITEQNEIDALDDKVDKNYSDMEVVTGSKRMTFVPGIYPTGATGDTIDISSPQTSSGGKYCAKSQVSEGQRLLLKTSSGSSSYKAFSITDENFKVIKVAGTTNAYDTEIEMPDEAAWVVVNSDPGDQYYAIILDKADNSEMESINQKIEAATGGRFLEFENGLFPTPAVGQQGSTARDSSSSRISAIAEIEEGETIKINTSTGSSTYHTFAILDEDEIVLVQGDKNSGTKEFVAPEGSKYLVVNTIATYVGYYAIVFHSQNNMIYDSLNVGMFNRIAVCGTSWDCSYGYSNYTGETHAYTRRSRSWIAVLANMYGIDYSCYGVPSATTVAEGSSHIGEHGAVCWQTNSYGLPKVLSDADDNKKSDLYWMDFYQNDWKKIGRYDATYLGTIDDIKVDYTENPDTFYGNYGRIVDQIIAKCPSALFIFSYKETASTAAAGKAYAEAVRAIAEHYGAPYINFEDDPWFLNWLEKHLVQDHPTFTDYAGIAKAAERLFAKCARENWEYFKNFVPAADT